jgi:beta-lactamase regulating signal transducer with metallopeptidase domain
MASVLGLLTAWLADFYVLATVLLAAEGLAASLVRRPARRMALARAALTGLVFLAVLLALPGRARLGLGLLALESGAASPGVAPWLAGLFLAGLLLISAWLLLGAFRAWLLAQRSCPAPAHLQNALRSVVGEDRSQPALHVGRDLQQPVALGAWRPLLVLPAHLATETPVKQVEAVLAHEWAHVRNGDLRWVALSRLLLLVLFAHPLFWLLRRRLRADQEMQADAVAAARGGPVDYAETLVEFARGSRRLDTTRPTAAVPTVTQPAGGSPLKRRIAALLHPDFSPDDAWAPNWHFAAAVLIVVAVALLSPVTLREIGSPPAPATLMARTPVAHAPGSPSLDLPPVVKIEIVVQMQAPEPPAEVAKQPPPLMPKLLVSRLDFTWFAIDWWNKHQTDWFYRLLKWWFAERIRR